MCNVISSHFHHSMCVTGNCTLELFIFAVEACSQSWRPFYLLCRTSKNAVLKLKL